MLLLLRKGVDWLEEKLLKVWSRQGEKFAITQWGADQWSLLPIEKMEMLLMPTNG